MKTLPHWLATALLLGTFAACSPHTAEGPPNTDFAGKWSGAAYKTGSANPTFSLDLQQTGATVTGTITSGDGTFQAVEMEDVHIDDEGSLIFRARSNGGGEQFKDHLFLFDAHRKGDTLEGTWTDILQGAQGPFTLFAGEGH